MVMEEEEKVSLYHSLKMNLLKSSMIDLESYQWQMPEKIRMDPNFSLLQYFSILFLIEIGKNTMVE